MKVRVFLAITLSMLILLVWPAISKNIFNYPIEPKEVIDEGTEIPQYFSQQTQEIEEPVETEEIQEPVKKPLRGASKIMINILTFLRNLLGNWGLALVVLSVLVWLIFSPLTAKSMKAMRRMQELQPKIEHLRQMYKDNPQRMNKEVMQLYRDERVNPLGGCLPMLLQLPVFFGLFQGLRNSDILKGANFLWIKDLNSPDQAFVVNGFSVNILPILMVIIMFLQQKQSTKNASGAQAEQQKIMATVFPVMFGFLFYKMASGLVLYWTVNSVLLYISQWKASRKKI